MCCRSSPRSTIRSIRFDYPLGWREYPPILWPEPLDKKGPESICGEWQLEREDSYGAAVFLDAEPVGHRTVTIPPVRCKVVANSYCKA
jgi:hypothetical protein